MWKQFLSGSAALVLGLSVVGCKSDGMADSMSKDDMMTVASSDKPGMMAAPMDGTYMLFSGSRSLMTVTLKKGDMMGFQTMDGKTMAMAGDQKMDVTGMPAMWQHGMQK